MTAARFLPHRWRQNGAQAAHAEAIAGVLDTPPVAGRADGLVLFAPIGCATLLPAMVALKSLWHPLRRGRVALLDDGTLTAEDRAVLAHHFADPQILDAETVRGTGFPAGRGWASLLAMLDGRSGEYWLRVTHDTVTLGDVPEITAAIGANRSLTDLAPGDGPHAPVPFPDIFETSSPNADRWRYVDAGGGLLGLAAGQTGRGPAEAALALLPASAPRHAATETQRRAAGFVIANETAPVCLPRDLYRQWEMGEDWRVGPAFLHFETPQIGYDNAWTGASRAAIAMLAV